MLTALGETAYNNRAKFHYFCAVFKGRIRKEACAVRIFNRDFQNFTEEIAAVTRTPLSPDGYLLLGRESIPDSYRDADQTADPVRHLLGRYFELIATGSTEAYNAPATLYVALN